jgi:group I intron endonuclease
MVGIYKITNPKDKIYIGQSKVMEDRFKQYNNPSSSRVGRKLLNSLNKYGIENHNIDILEECKFEELNEREIHYIRLYNSVEEGLNIDSGGKNYKRSKETKTKISQNRLGKNTKPILQYDLNNNFIKLWNSITSAEKVHGTGIKSCLVKKTQSAGGFIWRYKNDPLPSNYKFERWKNNKKKVIQMDLDGNFIKEWESLMSIQRELGFNNANISMCCLGQIKTGYGYKWEYKEYI